jgi:hypothetical protein
MAVLVGPDLTPHEVGLDQVAPGVYETDLGQIDSGAYAVRITQSRPGAAALGRTVGLVEPVAAEYRLLGINTALLASLRAATGGHEVALPTDPWTHDLRSTASFAELWPWLLVLALLLWPFDIALRRVSIGRRELADGRAWLGRRWRGRRAAAPRTTAAAGMLAARDRAAGAGARAALRQPESPGVETPESRPPVGGPQPTSPSAASGEDAAPATSPAPTTAEPADTLARLREAKRRARGG